MNKPADPQFVILAIPGAKDYLTLHQLKKGEVSAREGNVVLTFAVALAREETRKVFRGSGTYTETHYTLVRELDLLGNDTALSDWMHEAATDLGWENAGQC